MLNILADEDDIFLVDCLVLVLVLLHVPMSPTFLLVKTGCIGISTRRTNAFVVLSQRCAYAYADALSLVFSLSSLVFIYPENYYFMVSLQLTTISSDQKRSALIGSSNSG